MTYREAYSRMLEQQTEEWDIPPEEIHEYYCPDHVLIGVLCECIRPERGEELWYTSCPDCWDREVPAEPASWVIRR